MGRVNNPSQSFIFCFFLMMLIHLSSFHLQVPFIPPPKMSPSGYSRPRNPKMPLPPPLQALPPPPPPPHKGAYIYILHFSLQYLGFFALCFTIFSTAIFQCLAALAYLCRLCTVDLRRAIYIWSA